MAMQKVRYPRRALLSVLWLLSSDMYAEHCAIPPQRGRSDFVRRHQGLALKVSVPLYQTAWVLPNSSFSGPSLVTGCMT